MEKFLIYVNYEYINLLICLEIDKILELSLEHIALFKRVIILILLIILIVTKYYF